MCYCVFPCALFERTFQRSQQNLKLLMSSNDKTRNSALYHHNTSCVLVSVELTYAVLHAHSVNFCFQLKFFTLFILWYERCFGALRTTHASFTDFLNSLQLLLLDLPPLLILVVHVSLLPLISTTIGTGESSCRETCRVEHLPRAPEASTIPTNKDEGYAGLNIFPVHSC